MACSTYLFEMDVRMNTELGDHGWKNLMLRMMVKGNGLNDTLGVFLEQTDDAQTNDADGSNIVSNLVKG